jgi:hypothetical protein
MLGLGLGLFELGACRHRDRAPAPIASASASTLATAFADEARAAHFLTEQTRARDRWQSKPNLDECPTLLHKDGDAELCRAAQSALTAIEQLDPSSPAERNLPVLADGALALARLSERARLQSLAELGQRRMTGGSGATPAASGSAAATTKPALLKPTASSLRAPPLAPSGHPAETHALELELSESPVGRFLPVVLRLQRDALRNVGAYLEYAPLAARRAAFDSVKQLHVTHPQWALLDHVIREAALLESDPAQKLALKELAASGLPRGRNAVQPTDSK